MRSVLNLKSVKMITALVLTILLAASLIPAQVEADEVKWYKGDLGFTESGKMKIGSGYFWYDTEYTDEGSTNVLYYSAKKSAEGTKLVTIDGYCTFGDTVLFNGSKVYYTTMSDPFDPDANGKIKIKICSVSKTGKNKKTVKTISVSDDCLNTKLLSVYNNRLYFTRYNINWEGDVTEGKLFSMNTKKNADGKYKVRTEAKDFMNAETGNVSSRYIYSQASGTLKIYDCKSGEVAKSLKGVGSFYVGSKYVYCITRDDNNVYTLVQRSLSGKDKKVIKKLPDASTAILKQSGKLYYNEYNDAGEAKFYEYTVSKKSAVEITENQFMARAYDGAFGLG